MSLLRCTGNNKHYDPIIDGVTGSSIFFDTGMICLIFNKEA
jgi:hypothetical protein